MVREDDLRATFEALHAKGMPPRPFSAADVVREGNRQRRSHRMWAVIGTGVATAAAVVALLFFIPGTPPPEPVLPAEPPVSTTLPTTPELPVSSRAPEPPTSLPPGSTSTGNPSGSSSSTAPQTTISNTPPSVPST